MRTRACLISTVALIVLFVASSAWAVPTAVPYSGELTYEDGTPVAGPVSVRAMLFDTVAGDGLVWGPYTYAAVEVVGGSFTVVIGGEGSPALDDSDMTGSSLFLELSIDGMTMAPRFELLSVPYALLAADSERLGGEEAAAFVTDADLVGLASAAGLDQEIAARIADVDAEEAARLAGDAAVDARTAAVEAILAAAGLDVVMGCWDRDADSTCTLETEDADGDGACTVLDCVGAGVAAEEAARVAADAALEAALDQEIADRIADVDAEEAARAAAVATAHHRLGWTRRSPIAWPT